MAKKKPTKRATLPGTSPTKRSRRAPGRLPATDILDRMERGETLAAADIKQLREAIQPKLGRRPRGTLKLVRDEFGRAAAFAIARTAGQSYDKARDRCRRNSNERKQRHSII